MPAHTQAEGFDELFQPPDPNVQIWRYMDFTKYIALLEDRALYFARSDRLQDPFEGALPRPGIAALQDYYAESGAIIAAHQVSEKARAFRMWVYLNCWHMSPHESAAMWKLYAASDAAVAIQTTYTTLRDVLPDIAVIGMVRYIDYDQEWFSFKILERLSAFIHKRLSFEHEREVRAIIVQCPRDASGAFDPLQGTPPLGVSVPVPLEELIHAVYVAPTAPEWYASLVAKITRKYGLNCPVRASRLDDKPSPY